MVVNIPLSTFGEGNSWSSKHTFLLMEACHVMQSRLVLHWTQAQKDQMRSRIHTGKVHTNDEAQNNSGFSQRPVNTVILPEISVFECIQVINLSLCLSLVPGLALPANKYAMLNKSSGNPLSISISKSI